MYMVVVRAAVSQWSLAASEGTGKLYVIGATGTSIPNEIMEAYSHDGGLGY